MSLRNAGLAIALVLLGAAAAQALTPVQDEIIVISGGKMARGPLPAGPLGPPIELAQTLRMIHALPSGKILAVYYAGPQGFGLGELLADGSLRPIGVVPWLGAFQLALLTDMETDHRGRFYLLLDDEDPVKNHLVEVDPNTAAIVRSVKIEAQAIAYAPDGLWVVNLYELRKLDPDTLVLGPPLPLESAGPTWIANLEADSAGRLYFATTIPCSSPYCGAVGLLDPAAEGLLQVAPTSLFEWANHEYVNLAIRRRCLESSTARCLQGGRFRAELTYEAHDGAAGSARVAPARSSDTGVFYFFSEDNWELMVKVLDGCALNGKFWVFSSASTDVEYTMTITDTATGAQKVYTNPLGQVAKTVADTSAFACTP
jgi:hypothetical protein